mgnify:FL=1
MENYCKTINIEGLTASEMIRRDILPAISEYIGVLSETVNARNDAVDYNKPFYESKIIERLTEISSNVYELTVKLDEKLITARDVKNIKDKAEVYKSAVVSLMNKIRVLVDEAETITAAKYWPYPSYGKMLFGI